MVVLMISMLAFLFVGCEAVATNSPIMEHERTVKINEEIKISEDLSLKFSQVVEDSRCPEGVDCIWAGRAIVRIEIVRDEERHIFDLELGGEKATAVFQELRIVLKELSPYPKADEPLKPDEYSIKFELERIE
jgi:hypothetical protein